MREQAMAISVGGAVREEGAGESGVREGELGGR